MDHIIGYGFTLGRLLLTIALWIIIVLIMLYATRKKKSMGTTLLTLVTNHKKPVFTFKAGHTKIGQCVVTIQNPSGMKRTYTLHA